MLSKKPGKEKTSVTFHVQRDCDELSILGEFNDWQPEKMRKLKNKTFTKRYMLKNGAAYQYVLFDEASNVYFADNEADEMTQNTFGTYNSVVYV